jgi:hypothetical protein
MKTWTMRTGLAAVALLVGVAGPSEAALLTVEWTADSSNDGMGTGLLGATTVMYTSAPGSNSGTTLFGQNWAAFAGTDGATDGAVTSQTGGFLGAPTGATQTIEFSSDVTDPILLVNFLDQGDFFGFGFNSFTVLDLNNAGTFVGPRVGGFGATNTPDDGFAVRIAGTFGPGAPLTRFRQQEVASS